MGNYMSVAILTDTNSGIFEEEGQKAGISVIPMPVIVDGKSYLENQTIDHSQLYAAMRRDCDISTSQPAPQTYIEMWDKLLGEGYDEVVYIPMSSGLSTTCLTAQQFAKDYGGRVIVVDNHRISLTLRESVYDAKALADGGKSGQEIKERLEQNAYNACIYIAVNSMKYLVKNGRAGRSAATIATALNIKPVLSISGEKLDAFKKVRGMKKAVEVMIESVANDLKTRFSDIPRQRVVVGSAGTLERQEEVDECVNALKAAFPGYQVYYNPLSCSIACHVGIGAIGMGISIKTPMD